VTFPVVEAFSHGETAGGSTSHVMTLPTGIQAGDYLIAITCTKNNGGTTSNFPTGWVNIAATDVGGVDGTARVWYKIADGTEGSTVTATGSNTWVAYHIYRLSSAAGTPVAASTGTGFFTNPNPPNLVSGFGAVDTLWLAADFWNNGSATQTAYPSTYTNGSFDQSGSNPPAVGSARKQTTAASEDPGAFTLTVGPWAVAMTIGIKGGAPALKPSPVVVIA
jgi:hypothetical protein